MKIFIDTANVDEIRDAATLGIIDGVTTNPSLIAKEGRKLEDVIKEITSIVDGPISGEIKATTTKAKEMIEEGKQIAALHKNMVVKIPMTKDGIIATYELSKLNIKTNVTLIFSVPQAIMAAKAGATYVSPFIGRLDDIQENGVDLIYEISNVFEIYNYDTEIIAASIRSPLHVREAAKAGADICTIPYKVLMQMIKHPLTSEGIEKFINDYNKVFKD